MQSAGRQAQEQSTLHHLPSEELRGPRASFARDTPRVCATSYNEREKRPQGASDGAACSRRCHAQVTVKAGTTVQDDQQRRRRASVQRTRSGIEKQL